MAGRILTVNEVSRHCSVRVKTVMKWIDEGKLPVFKTPAGHRRVLRTRFVEFLHKQRHPLPPAFQPAPHKRVLGVDDDPQIVYGLTRFIRRIDPTILVESARGGEEACEKLPAFKPHLVILDLLMPGLDGFSVCKRIRSDRKYSHTKILAFTGLDNPETRNRILSDGADDYLGKPFDLKDLQGKIRRLLDL